MAMKQKRLAVEVRIALAATEDGPTALVQDPVRDELVDRATRLKGRVQLHDRLWPQKAFGELVVYVIRYPRIADVDETPREVRVVVDKTPPELENVHLLRSHRDEV